MRTPYIPFLFGDFADEKLKCRRGWLTYAVASSIAWPQESVWLMYDGDEYVLRGVKDDAQHRSPCISTPCARDDMPAATTRLYKFASILGWFKNGYVDPTDGVWGTAAILAGSRESVATLLEGNRFDCNYMPIIEDDSTRQAIAFLREGRRLRNAHKAYSFLSFFKVLESQLPPKSRVAWMKENVELLDGKAAERVAALKAEGLEVGRHLYQSGRCAVAHVSIGETVVDPDIWEDRRRISEDLVVMDALAKRYVGEEIKVPTERSLYTTRDRALPWHPLLPEETLRLLQTRGDVSLLTDREQFGRLNEARLSVRIWPNEPEPLFRALTLFPEATVAPGMVQFIAQNERNTMLLRFLVDFAAGRAHTLIEQGVLTEEFGEVTDDDVASCSRYFHSVVGNALIELCIDGMDPVQCEIVIPVNVMPRVVEEAVAEAVEQHRARRAERGSRQQASTE